MKITVVSDLHLEFSSITLTNPQQSDVLILSGDILMSEYLHDYPVDSTEPVHNSSRNLKAWRFREFLKECSEEFKNVIYIAGNHDLKPHVDYDPSYISRYHIPIITNPKVTMYMKRNSKTLAYHMPADGRIYFLYIADSI